MSPLREQLEDLRANISARINDRRGHVVAPPFRFRGSDLELCAYIEHLAALTDDQPLCRRVGAVIEEVRQREAA